MQFGIFTIVPWHESKGQQQSLDAAVAGETVFTQPDFADAQPIGQLDLNQGFI